MSDVFREVDEDVRRDEYLRLWRRYGTWAIAGLVGIVVAVSASVGWREYRRSALNEEGDRFAAALELKASGKTEEAIAAFDALAEATSGGYGRLAELEKAEMLAREGKTVEAMAAYDALAMSGASQEFRDLAGLFAAMLAMGSEDAASVDARLEKLDRPDNPWRYSVKELKGLSLHKKGDPQAAKLFEELAEDATAPANLRERAKNLATALGVQS